jgi:hypothetical protein
MSRRVVALISAVALCGSPSAWGKTQVAKGYQFPVDKPVTIITLRPDVSVGSLDAGGVEEANADWTASARANLAQAITVNQDLQGNKVVSLAEQTGDDAKTVDEYQKLFHAVSAAIYLHKFVIGAQLPTKKNAFDWTLGPGAARLGEIGGGNYALFLYTHDSFGTAGRKAMQVAGILGCGIGVCVFFRGGVHFYYASLVDLQTGDVVWFNYVPSAEGDIRNAAGAQQLIDKLLSTMPKRQVTAAGS